MLFIYVFNGSRIPLLVSFLLLLYKPLGLLLKVDFVLDSYANLFSNEPNSLSSLLS